MRSKKNEERLNEIKRDFATSFTGQEYVSTGYTSHFHRNLEIYGVVDGSVTINIAGESKTLTNGQIAVVNRLESHSYEIAGEAKVIWVHIGTSYLRIFDSIYPDKRPARWLMDAEYNQVLYESMKKIRDASEEPILEIKRVAITCQIFSDIIEHYGFAEKLSKEDEKYDLIVDVVQYIYDHYNEDISLETLSKQFYVSPNVLSKKLRKVLNVDLRVFVNDIRVQNAVQMLDDPSNKDKSLDEIITICGFNCPRTFYRAFERNFKFYKLKRQ